MRADRRTRPCPPAPSVSVLTLVRKRQCHLDALVAGLARRTCNNFELVVASMQPEPPRICPSVPFTVSVVDVPGERLPLAAARNAAARQARADRLIFLDVDCIPSPSLVESFIRQLEASARCLMGEVRYLPGTLTDEQKTQWPFDRLQAHAIRHPARPVIEDNGWREEQNPRALWGLSFALTRTQYFSVGGMDEAYEGYGGEETDFAERLAAAGMRLGWCGNALSLHQHHTMYTPPLDRFDEILANARRFYARWGSWCMEYWLDYFQSHGLISWTSDAPEIIVIRPPTQTEIDNCRQPPEVAFA